MARDQSDSSAPEDDGPSSDTAEEGSRSDILIVDDDPGNLLAIEAALGELAPHLVKASSGTEALRQLLGRDFALILLDVQMPDFDGFETARLIRARPRTRHVPIIFVTGQNRDDRDVLQGYSLGAVDFLFKPIVAEVLRAKAMVFVELQRRTAEVQRQAALIRKHERLEHERQLLAERQQWEAEALRRQMLEQQHLNERLQEADRRKDEFLAVLGHELRNPLTPIATSVELLRNVPDETVRGTAAIMQRQVRYLTRLVDDLLDVSRITRGKIELRKEQFELASAVDRAIETVGPFIEERQHELVVEGPRKGVVVDGDPVRITQVLANLVHNAARYTEIGGRIGIEWSAESGQAVVRVSDTGRGISPENIDRIFEKFVQERDGGKGLGLGLTLVRHLVELHGGSVAAASNGQGQGAEFTVTLPLQATAHLAKKAPKKKQARANGGKSKPLHVALVDDDPDIRETVRMLLERWGHRVDVACDGPSAVELLLRELPDVALLDVGLPGLDGYGVAQRVRAELPNGRPRLIAMTGYGQESDRKRALDAGFDAHLIKPATAADLRSVLEGGPHPDASRPPTE